MMPTPSALDARLGPGLAAARRSHERRLWSSQRRRHQAWWHPARYLSARRVVPFALKLTGLWRRAHAQCLAVGVVENEVLLPSLPTAFDGFRLLQITDLHTDIDPALPTAVIAALRGIRFDLAVVTGDFHNEIGEDWADSIAQTATIIPHLGPTPLATLGNHDLLDMVPPLEAVGLRFLLNENVALDRDGQRLWIAGIDDASYYRTHLPLRARDGVPADACAILLSHSPECFRESTAAGFAWQVSGHTHGGQICLPGGLAVLRKAAVPGRMIAGPWRHQDLVGYTSRGTGSCTAAARLNCPPEITVHTLRRCA